MKVVDLFAGAGGFSLGAEMAGCQVIWAANHWPAAVDAYRANHPRTRVACQDLHQADWSQVPEHDLLIASPACQGHCKARGKDRPHHDTARSTAWAVVSCAEVHRPARVVVENVPEFLRWALFPAWSAAMQALGYQLSHQVVDAADSGVPQHRRRVFITAALGKATPLAIPTRPHAPARGILSRGDRWSDVDSKCARTRARVRHARETIGDEFLVAYYGTERGGRSLDKPLGTVTTRDRFAVVQGERMRMLSVPEYQAAMGFPPAYQLPRNKALAIHLLGNAVPPPLAMDVIGSLMNEKGQP